MNLFVSVLKNTKLYSFRIQTLFLRIKPITESAYNTGQKKDNNEQ